MCSLCKMALYCDSNCQRQHWYKKPSVVAGAAGAAGAADESHKVGRCKLNKFKTELNARLV